METWVLLLKTAGASPTFRGPVRLSEPVVGDGGISPGLSGFEVALWFAMETTERSLSPTKLALLLLTTEVYSL